MGDSDEESDEEKESESKFAKFLKKLTSKESIY